MILGKTPPKAMEWGWAPPTCTEKVRSFVTFSHGWPPLFIFDYLRFYLFLWIVTLFFFLLPWNLLDIKWTVSDLTCSPPTTSILIGRINPEWLSWQGSTDEEMRCKSFPFHCANFYTAGLSSLATVYMPSYFCNCATNKNTKISTFIHCITYSAYKFFFFLDAHCQKQ